MSSPYQRYIENLRQSGIAPICGSPQVKVFRFDAMHEDLFSWMKPSVGRSPADISRDGGF